MASIQKKRFDSPDREIQPPEARGALVDFDGMTVGRYRYEPGWRWIDSLAGGDPDARCQVEHFGYALNGRLRVRHSDGTVAEVGPGDVYHIAPGHQGEVDGEEPFETIEFLPLEGDSATRRSALG